jgi:hypothetical protein
VSFIVTTTVAFLIKRVLVIVGTRWVLFDGGVDSAPVIVESLLNPINALPGFVDCFSCCVCCLLILFALRSTLPGVARRLLTFFVSPKKVSKERRPRDPGPSDFPVLRSKKWEGKQTRYAQTSFPSFSIFRIASPAGSKRNFLHGSLRIAFGGSPSAS